ncbi:TPA_asm: hypothetical protein [Anelosimus tangle-web spider MELD virus]|nr:TPA_asm: hypothetical protein [Anelosimus tangle-web spider MELD virus]
MSLILMLKQLVMKMMNLILMMTMSLKLLTFLNFLNRESSNCSLLPFNNCPKKPLVEKRKREKKMVNRCKNEVQIDFLRITTEKYVPIVLKKRTIYPKKIIIKKFNERYVVKIVFNFLHYMFLKYPDELWRKLNNFLCAKNLFHDLKKTISCTIDRNNNLYELNVVGY